MKQKTVYENRRKHSLYVSALASRKGGWSGIRLAFRRELPTLKLGFSLPFLFLETTDTFW